MTVKTNRRQRCQQCARPKTHCLCALIPNLPSQTRVLLIQHPSETKHALNTARMTALGLQNAELIVAETVDNLEQHLQQPGYRPCLLFPGEDAQLLTAYQTEQLPWLLVVPDGTWRKARRILYANPLLAALPRVTLPSCLRSRYRLRKAPHTQALATVEAVSYALDILEPTCDFSPLLRPFDALIEGQIQAMGMDTYQRHHLDNSG